MSNIIWDIQLVDLYTGKPLNVSGGVVQVCKAGTVQKATLQNPDAQMASLANPVTPNRGKIRFAITQAGPGQAAPPAVDIYGISGDGRTFVMKGALPGNPTEITVNTNDRDQVLVVPFSSADCTPGTEKDTGFVLPSGAMVTPLLIGRVLTTAAGKTVSAGLLSSQAGGSATGLINGMSVATAGTVKPTINGASPTLGSFLSVNSGAGSTAVGEGYVVGATAVNVSYTLAAGAQAEGLIILNYLLPPI